MRHSSSPAHSLFYSMCLQNHTGEILLKVFCHDSNTKLNENLYNTCWSPEPLKKFRLCIPPQFLQIMSYWCRIYSCMGVLVFHSTFGTRLLVKPHKKITHLESLEPFSLMKPLQQPSNGCCSAIKLACVIFMENPSKISNTNFTFNFLTLMLLLKCFILFLSMAAVYQCRKLWVNISLLSDLTLLYVWRRLG